jgi:dihydroorotase
MLTHFVETKKLSLSELIVRMSLNPARAFRLPGGTLREGSDGDVTVFDPAWEWVVDPAAFHSKGRNTPFTGDVLRGRTVLTVVGGRVIHEERAGGK